VYYHGMDTKKPDYSSWQAADFLADVSFQEWVRSRLKGEVYLPSHWEKLRLGDPRIAAAMDEAEETLVLLYSRQPTASPDPEGRTLVWDNIRREIGRKRASFFTWGRVAAVCVPLIGLCVAILFMFRKQPEPALVAQKTQGNGAFRVFVLPDESQVMLGANSEIRYTKDWKTTSGRREVWLNGDAHFEVKHLNRDSLAVKEEEKFVVIVNEILEVEVLGTVFNIWNRDGKISVGLESGKVKLRRRPEGTEVLLKPGETARFSGNQFEILHHTPQLVLHEATHDKLYELNNTSVEEIVGMIERMYDKKVVVEDSSILRRRIDGVLPLCHENDLLFALSGILDITVETRENNQLIFH